MIHTPWRLAIAGGRSRQTSGVTPQKSPDFCYTRSYNHSPIALIAIFFLFHFSTLASAQQELDKTLTAILAGKSPLEPVRIDAQWPGNFRGITVMVQGQGVGIWRHQKQFPVKPAQVRELLERLQKAKFTEMPLLQGHLPPSAENPQPGPLENLLPSLKLTIGQLRHEVTPLPGTDPPAGFSDLTLAIINQCEKWTRDGVEAESVTDGLRKLRAGKLVPLTFALDITSQRNAGEGWWARLGGDTLLTGLRTTRGEGPRKRYQLSREQLDNLLKLLLDNRCDELPAPLSATSKVSVRVRVLEGEKQLRAQPSSGEPRPGVGEHQKRFDRIFAALHQLHLRALKEGQQIKGSR